MGALLYVFSRGVGVDAAHDGNLDWQAEGSLASSDDEGGDRADPPEA